MQLIAVTFVRPGELRHAEWKEFDIPNAIWNIPAEKMKMNRPHKVPLSRQAVALIDRPKKSQESRDIFFRKFDLGIVPFLMALNAALRRLGYSKTEMTAHGFRRQLRLS